MEHYKETYVGEVKVLEKPNSTNGYFYVVESDKGTHTVSALFGKVANNSKKGKVYKLYIRSNNFTTFYFLKE